VAGTALAAEAQIEVAQSLLAEVGNTALVQVQHKLLAEQRTSFVAVRIPWSEELHMSLRLVAHTEWAEQHIALVVHT